MHQASVVNPWTDRNNLGVFAAFFVSVKMLILQPRQFFASWMPEQSVLGPAVFLGLSQIFIVTLLTSALTVAFPATYLAPGTTIKAQLLSFLLSPAMTLLSAFLMAFGFYLAVKIVRGQGGYREAFSVLAFISVSNLIMLFPAQTIAVKVVLSLLSFVWNTALLAIGFHETQKLTWGRVAGAIALGYLFVTIIGIGMSMAFVGFSGGPQVCPIR